mgnify:CR=1 FL=1
MTRVLVVAEHQNGKLNASTAKCVSAAKALQPDAIDVIVLSNDPAAIAAQAACIDGVATVIAVADPANAHPIAQIQAPQIAKVAQENGYDTILFANSVLPGRVGDGHDRVTVAGRLTEHVVEQREDAGERVGRPVPVQHVLGQRDRSLEVVGGHTCCRGQVPRVGHLRTHGCASGAARHALQ